MMIQDIPLFSPLIMIDQDCLLWALYVLCNQSWGRWIPLPKFLNGNLKFAPKENVDIPMSSFIETFSELFKDDVARVWRTLFECGPEKPTSRLKEVLVKVQDRTVPKEEMFLTKLRAQWKHCPHGDDV